MARPRSRYTAAPLKDNSILIKANSREIPKFRNRIPLAKRMPNVGIGDAALNSALGASFRTGCAAWVVPRELPRDASTRLVSDSIEGFVRWVLLLNSPHLYNSRAACLLSPIPKIALCALHSFPKIGLIHDVVPVEDGPRFVTADRHGNALRHACPNHVSHSRSPEVMEDAPPVLGCSLAVFSRPSI